MVNKKVEYGGARKPNNTFNNIMENLEFFLKLKENNKLTLICNPKNREFVNKAINIFDLKNRIVESADHQTGVYTIIGEVDFKPYIKEETNNENN